MRHVGRVAPVLVVVFTSSKSMCFNVNRVEVVRVHQERRTLKEVLEYDLSTRLFKERSDFRWRDVGVLSDPQQISVRGVGRRKTTDQKTSVSFRSDLFKKKRERNTTNKIKSVSERHPKRESNKKVIEK